MQQNDVQIAYKTGTIKATVNNCHFTQYYNEYFTQSKVHGCMGNTHNMLSVYISS